MKSALCDVIERLIILDIYVHKDMIVIKIPPVDVL